MLIFLESHLPQTIQLSRFCRCLRKLLGWALPVPIELAFCCPCEQDLMAGRSISIRLSMLKFRLRCGDRGGTFGRAGSSSRFKRDINSSILFSLPSTSTFCNFALLQFEPSVSKPIVKCHKARLHCIYTTPRTPLRHNCLRGS